MTDQIVRLQLADLRLSPVEADIVAEIRPVDVELCSQVNRKLLGTA